MTATQELRQMAKRLTEVADALESCTMASPVPQQQRPNQPTQKSITKDPDAPASDAQYRMMFAIWHKALREDPALKPRKGMTKGQVSDWVETHQRG